MALRRIYGTCTIPDCGREAQGRIKGTGVTVCRRCWQRWYWRMEHGLAPPSPTTTEEVIAAITAPAKRTEARPDPQPNVWKEAQRAKRPTLTEDDLRARFYALRKAEDIENWLDHATSTGGTAILRLVCRNKGEATWEQEIEVTSLREELIDLAAKLRRRAQEV